MEENQTGNQKPDNGRLEEALEEFSKDRRKENYARVMEILEKSVVLVPTMPPRNLDEETQRLMKEGKPVKLPKEAEILPCLLRKETGEMALPVFSSAAQIPQDKKSPAVLAMPFFGMLGMVTSNQDKIEGGIVNPFTHSMVLTKAVLEVARKRKDAMGKPQTKTIKVTEKQFRDLAHNRVVMYLLPKYLFEHKEEGLARLQREEGAFLLPFYGEVYPEGMKPVFTEDDFSVMTLNITDTIQLTRVDMPDEAVKKGMCYRAYAAWEREKEEISYYTLEKTEQGNYIGRIWADGRHEQVEPAPDNGAEIEAVMRLVASDQESGNS